MPHILCKKIYIFWLFMDASLLIRAGLPRLSLAKHPHAVGAPSVCTQGMREHKECSFKPFLGFHPALPNECAGRCAAWGAGSPCNPAAAPRVSFTYLPPASKMLLPPGRNLASAQLAKQIRRVTKGRKWGWTCPLPQ